jgi:SAM-dependent methyltransferase
VTAFSRAYHWFYLWAQKRQSWAKRAKDPAFRTSRHIESVRFALPMPWPEPVLCLGPRNGLELQYLRAEGIGRVVGLDLFSLSPDIKVGDMHDMPFPANSFGMIWASHVLEHARDAHQVAAEILRVLKPSGYLFFAYPANFTPNWHDRHSYGEPSGFRDRYFPGHQLLYSDNCRSGDSEEWSGLMRSWKS